MDLLTWNMPAQSRALNRDLSVRWFFCLMTCKWNCYCFFVSHLWAPLFLTVGCLCQTIKVEKVFKLVRGFIDINEREVGPKINDSGFPCKIEKRLKCRLILRYMILPWNNIFLLPLYNGVQVFTFVYSSFMLCLRHVIKFSYINK